MTPIEQDLLTYLRAVATALHGRPTYGPHRYASYEALVLARGKLWTPAPLPPIVGRGAMKYCYANTLDLVRLAQKTLDLGLTYCEGYAIPMIDDFTGIPVQHAWAVDADGEVWDPTWPEPERGAYYGITFTWEEVQRFDLLDPDCLGILPSNYLLDCPLLRTGELFPEGDDPEALFRARRARQEIEEAAHR